MIWSLPLLIWLSMVALMVATVWQFNRYRWAALKDRLARLWPEDRQANLHLEAGNGFIVISEFPMRWSESLLKLAWIPALPLLAQGVEAIASGGFLIASGFVLRSAVVLRIAGEKVRRFSDLFGYDGFGIYQRARCDWAVVADENRAMLRRSAAIAIILLAAISM